jgi:hypothetical protein
LFEQPKTLDARSEIAQVCSFKLELSIPTLIDDMENSTDRKYYALPDRLYLVGRDGRVAYRAYCDAVIRRQVGRTRTGVNTWQITPITRRSISLRIAPQYEL